MKIIRARHLGLCFGVRDALALAQSEADRQPLTILGELVHNPVILRQLQDRQIPTETQLDSVKTPAVMITAHGASDLARRLLRERRFNVIEATCPLVRVAHDAALQLAAAGFYPIVIGKAGHVEVRGLTEDLPEFSVVLEESDLDRLPSRTRYGVMAQTTQPIDRVRRWVAAIRQRFPEAEVRFVDTVCRPTKLRQTAAAELARHCDRVVVVGGAKSNNTRELANTCRRFCPRVVQVESPDQLEPEWFDGAARVGITAGTSTPDETIDAVERRIEGLARERQFQRALAAG